ncbi:MAG: hypothetical protein KAI66_25985, partial [Lentisphaeria bacterium]|nr:hypothetical protein [Lentisphaeria bacterium]
MLAPAVQIDDVTYGFVTPARAREVLTDFLSEHAGKSVSTATLPDHPEEGREVRICQCSSCLAAGAGEVADAARKALKDLAPTVPVRSVGCTGISFEAPLLEIEVAGGQIFRYGRVPANRVGAILRRHFQARNPFSRTRGLVSGLLERLYARGESNPVTRHSLDDAEALHAYVAPQRQRALEHAGAIDPLCIDAYRDRGGLQALAHVVQADDPEQTIGQLEAYGLRGRGGGGFPTARKWRTVLTEPGPEKYVICNADEGDPGAFMDR